MNERIKELAEQAGIHPTNFEPDADIKIPLEKFAQLIVQECLGLLGPESAYGKQHIKKHFGVEEQTIKQDQVHLPTTREQAMAMLRVATFYLDTQK